MRPMLQHASRSLFSSIHSIASQQSAQLKVRNVAKRSVVCWSCQLQAASTSQIAKSRSTLVASAPFARTWVRRFSSERHTPDAKKQPEIRDAHETPTPSSQASEASTASEAPAQTSRASPSTTSSLQADEGPPAIPLGPAPSLPADDIKRVPAEELPSHRDKQRWDLSKRFSEIMDDLLPKLAVVTQKVNTYTGTDYSGIEALRREIKEQEQLVKSRHKAIDQAKQVFDAAHALQAASQKEVVALLERKHSWSATDLERYMSLIRSEHVNERAVRDAKEAATAAESALEEARSQLEKRERAQYHEEQIWSDTIRRNSTWVTFGLMGFNIFLLLVSLIIIEPWRRRRMVREIKDTLEAQKPVIPVTTALPATAVIEAAIDQVVDSESEVAEIKSSEAVAAAELHEVEPVAIEAAPVGIAPADSAPVEAPQEGQTFTVAKDTEQVRESEADTSVKIESRSAKAWSEWIKFRAQDLVSEDLTSIRKKDLSTAVLTSASVGFIVATIISLTINRTK